MGCTGSNLNRVHSFRKRSSSNKSFSRQQKQSNSAVGIFLPKGYPLRVIESDSYISQSLHKEEALKAFHERGQATEEVEEEVSEDLSEILSWNDFSSNTVGSKEGEGIQIPRKLCTEQERRLRCLNLEVPTAGLAELSSDEDDDERDGFKFAKVEGSVASFNSDQGHIQGLSWTPITGFNSEQGLKKIPLLGATLDSPGSEVLATDISFSEHWDEVQDSSISEPELQILIYSNYIDLPLSDSDNYFSPLSPGSSCSSLVSPCSPSLERFTSNSIDHLTGLINGR